jgi:hypothetical protein
MLNNPEKFPQNIYHIYENITETDFNLTIGIDDSDDDWEPAQEIPRRRE